MHSNLLSEEIIRADHSHLELLTNFQIKLAFESEGLELDPQTVSEGILKVLAEAKDSYYLLYLQEKTPRACLLIQKEWSDWRSQSVLWLHSVYVEKNFRKKGIFKKIYQNLQAQVKADPSLAGLRLFVDKKNYAAIKTYQALRMDDSHYTLFEWLA